MRIHALTVGLAIVAFAASAPAGAQNASVNTAVREELIVSFADAADKVVALAEAIPAEKYAWRPSEGVRSVSEVAMHVASANFYFSRLLGMPSDVALKDLEKETDKEKIVAMLRKSIEHAKKAIGEAPDAEMDRMRDLFGSRRSGRAIALILVSHSHEHLGQLIAYARLAGVVPPWSS